MRDLVYYIASSLDGFIAGPDGDVSAFPQDPATLADLFARYPETCPVQVREALGVSAAPRRFDTVLMGRRTYAPALEAGLPGGAYPHLRQIIATHRPLPEAPGLETMSGDVAGTVRRLLAEPGGDVWLCGGAELAAQLIDLIDEIQIKTYPVLLGAGTPLLPVPDGPRPLVLVGSTTLPGGALLTTYRRP